MFEMWKGVVLATLLQWIVGLTVYEFTLSPKFMWASMYAVAAISGIIVLGAVMDQGSDTYKGHRGDFAFVAVGYILVIAGFAFLFEWTLDEMWRETRHLLWIPMVVLWYYSAIWIREQEKAVSAFWLTVIAAPFGIGAFVGGVMLVGQILSTGKLKIGGKYKRVFGI